MRQPCSYCGLPFQVRRVEPGQPVYCCAGCALADRVRAPGSDGNFPITPELVLTLVAGFGAFNQALFALLAWLIAHDGRLELAVRFSWISLVVGPVVWGLGSWNQRRAGARGGMEITVGLLTLVVIICGWLVRSPGCALGGTLGLLVWQSRGWFRARRSSSVHGLREE